jgi:predicted nuclease of predicted toxin-antitoxin system
VHVHDVGLQQASDDVIFDYAQQEERVVVSADTDFGTILATRQQRLPSVVLFRRGAQRRPSSQVSLCSLRICPPSSGTSPRGALSSSSLIA